MISMNKAARQIGCSNHTVRKWVEAGVIPAWRLPSGRVRITVEDWEAFLKALPPACTNMAKVEVLAVLEVVKQDH